MRFVSAPITCCWNYLWTAGPTGDDKSAHAGIDYAPWWLNQINWLDQINGTRTLDVFDIHAYFGDNINTTGFTNPQMRAEVHKYLRQYWDPTYYNSGDDADWITTTQPNRGVTVPHPPYEGPGERHLPGNTALVHRVGIVLQRVGVRHGSLRRRRLWRHGPRGPELLHPLGRTVGDRQQQPISLIPTTPPSSCGPTTMGPITASAPSRSRIRPP